MFGWSNLGRPDRVNASRVVIERVGKATIIVGLAILSVVAASAIWEFSADSAGADASDKDVAEKHDIVRLDRKLPARRIVDRKPPSGPVLRVLNAGTVDSDPRRHAETVAAMERNAAVPVHAVTDDDDLTPTGTYADWYPAKLKTYRTVCVRICDGALTPISFATTQDRLALDALRCRKSCGSPSKLYIQRNPATEADGLVDLDGRPYAQLSTAFKFRTNYDDACTCRPHAWQSLALVRHRLFEIQARQRHGRDVVLSRLAVIKSAAFKSTRVATARARTGTEPGSAIVTGSNSVMSKTSAVPHVAAATGVGSASSSNVELDETLAADKTLPKASKRKSKMAKTRAVALAKAKAARAKKVDTAALLVMFGSSEAEEMVISGKLSPASRPLNNVRSAASKRRYDGNDWRISIYEPM